MRWRRRNFASSLRTFASASGEKASPPPKLEPVTAAEAQALAAEFGAAFSPCDAERLAGLIDAGYLVRRAVEASQLTGPMRRKVALLLRHEISLLGYHLPLDRHPEVGNNAVAARALGLVDLTPFALHEGLPTGFFGRFPAPVAATELVARCRGLFRQEPLAFLAGPDPLTTVGIVSGGAQREVHQAIAAGLDAYITGEATEWVMATARENRIHYLAVGHHAGERLGVLTLGEHLTRELGLEVTFVDIPNPV